MWEYGIRVLFSAVIVPPCSLANFWLMHKAGHGKAKISADSSAKLSCRI